MGCLLTAVGGLRTLACGPIQVYLNTARKGLSTVRSHVSFYQYHFGHGQVSRQVCGRGSGSLGVSLSRRARRCPQRDTVDKHFPRRPRCLDNGGRIGLRRPRHLSLWLCPRAGRIAHLWRVQMHDNTRLSPPDVGGPDARAEQRKHPTRRPNHNEQHPSDARRRWPCWRRGWWSDGRTGKLRWRLWWWWGRAGRDRNVHTVGSHLGPSPRVPDPAQHRRTSAAEVGRDRERVLQEARGSVRHSASKAHVRIGIKRTVRPMRHPTVHAVKARGARADGPIPPRVRRGARGPHLSAGWERVSLCVANLQLHRGVWRLPRRHRRRVKLFRAHVAAARKLVSIEPRVVGADVHSRRYAAAGIDAHDTTRTVGIAAHARKQYVELVRLVCARRTSRT
eukprot:6306620-Prymnesium_polylepis.1